MPHALSPAFTWFWGSYTVNTLKFVPSFLIFGASHLAPFLFGSGLRHTSTEYFTYSLDLTNNVFNNAR